MCEKPDIIDLPETWLRAKNNNAELHLDDSVLFRRHRVNRRGGGVIGFIRLPLFHGMPYDCRPSFVVLGYFDPDR